MNTILRMLKRTRRSRSTTAHPHFRHDCRERDETVELPEWFDETLKQDLMRKRFRRSGRLHVLDQLVFSLLDVVASSSYWRYGREYSWKDLEALIHEDCSEVRKSGFKPETIVGIKSGGAFIANFVARCLAVRPVHYIRVSHYAPIFGSAVLPVLLRCRSLATLVSHDAMTDLRGRSVLLVDDQIRTGRSMEAAQQWVRQRGAGEVRTYCVFCQGARTDFGNRDGIMMRVPWGTDP